MYRSDGVEPQLPRAEQLASDSGPELWSCSCPEGYEPVTTRYRAACGNHAGDRENYVPDLGSLGVQEPDLMSKRAEKVWKGESCERSRASDACDS